MVPQAIQDEGASGEAYEEDGAPAAKKKSHNEA